MQEYITRSVLTMSHGCTDQYNFNLRSYLNHFLSFLQNMLQIYMIFGL